MKKVQAEALSAGLLLRLFFTPENEGAIHVPPERRLSFSGLHGIKSLGTQFFTITNMRTSKYQIIMIDL
jgi:hypothetical protein